MLSYQKRKCNDFKFNCRDRRVLCEVFLELFVPEEKVNDGLRFLGSLFSLSKCGVKMNFCVRKIVEK